MPVVNFGVCAFFEASHHATMPPSKPPCYNLLHLTLNMTSNLTFLAAMLIRRVSEVLGCNGKFKYIFLLHTV